jgi:hypothetical protein
LRQKTGPGNGFDLFPTLRAFCTGGRTAAPDPTVDNPARPANAYDILIPLHN